ncbi:MAG TPA: hypothetical protein VJK53_01920 [Candidatus Paceibacterota bacterium]
MTNSGRTRGSKGSSKKTAILVGALAAAAAGYYFYKSVDAKKHRQIAAQWAKQFKKDVLVAARKAKTIDRESLGGIVGHAAKAYRGLKQIDRGELERAARELKNNWKNVAKEIGKSVSATKKTVRKAARKASKRAQG